MLVLNKILLIGQIGREIELRQTVAGRSVCTFDLATHGVTRSPDGPTREQTQWHRIVAWDQLGELCQAQLNMGDTVYVEGRIHYLSPEQLEAEQRQVEVVATNVQFIKHRELPEKPDLFTEENPK